MGSFLTGATGTGNGFQAGSANITHQNGFLDAQKQLAAGNYNQTFGNQNQLAQQLQGIANGSGPNPAQIQLQQATNRNIQQNAGLIASQKGLSPALAQRLIAQNAAASGQQAAGQGALMGAQQQVGAMGQLANVYGQQQQGALGLQGTIQNAYASQNNADVGNQSNMNNVNGATAAGNQNMGGKLVGGLLGGVSGALGFADGGQVPSFSGGFSSGFNGSSATPQSSAGQFVNQPLFDLKGAIGRMFSSSSPNADDSTEQSYLDADSKMSDMDQASGVPSMHTVDMPAAQSQPMQMQPQAAPVMSPNQPMFAAQGGMAGLRSKMMASGGEPVGQVPGQAAVPGNSLANDKVPAMLSPKEIVIPRSITTHPNAPELAAQFVRQELQKHNAPKKNYDDGGQVPNSLNAYDPAMTNMPDQFIPAGPEKSSLAQFGERVGGTLSDTASQIARMAGMINDSVVSPAVQGAGDLVGGVARGAGVQLPQAQAPAPVEQAQPAPGLNDIPNMNQVGQQQGPMSAMNDAMSGGYKRAAGEQMAGFNQAAQAQQKLGDENARIAQQQQQAQGELAADANNKMEGYMEDYDKAMQDYKDGHINPNHYTENMDAVGKTKTAIGLILGGMAGGLLGQENPAAKFLSQQIDRDIDAQKQDLGKKANLLTANLHKMGNLKDATEMTRAMMMGIQASQFQEAAAKAQGPMAKALAHQNSGLLLERIAPIMAQIGMRQALMGGMKQGGVDPAMAINFMAPEGQKVELMKQYQTAQNMSKQKDNLLNAFDQVNKVQTVAGRLSSPLQSGRQAETLTQPLLAQLIKDSEGRITPQDTAMMEGLFPKVGDSDPTRRLKRSQLNKFVSEKMNFPGLDMYGYRPSEGRYDASGKDRLPPMAPPKK